MTETVSNGTPDPAGARRRFAMAGGLVVLAIAMGLGTFPARVSSTSSTRPLRDKSAKKLVDVLSQTIETKGIAAAVEQYRSLREQGFPGLYESESQTNGLGYRLLKKGELASAIQVLQLNAATHPESANVHDSLGEAYLAAGNPTLAAESYQRAVAIDPTMKSAAAELQRLTNFKRAPYRPIVLFHITAGTLGILSGALAISLRKGSRRHGLVGRVFVVSMLCMSASGATRAFLAPDGEPLNILMGLLTFYLVFTAWLTARRNTGGTGPLDWSAMLLGASEATGLL
ncbi:MAG: tetratricopeptide repeat protein, partial [bacterium]